MAAVAKIIQLGRDNKMAELGELLANQASDGRHVTSVISLAGSTCACWYSRCLCWPYCVMLSLFPTNQIFLLYAE